MPLITKDCKEVTTDLSQLLKMAEIFTHPWSMLYKVGKSLVVNGVDVITKIEGAIQAYKE